MVQSPSWEAKWFATSQEILRISRNPKVHHRTHKRPPPVSILGPPNPVHIPTSHLLEIHPNIINTSTPRSTQWFLPSGFPSKTLYTPLSSPIRATWPAHRILQTRKWLFVAQQGKKVFHFTQNINKGSSFHPTSWPIGAEAERGVWKWPLASSGATEWMELHLHSPIYIQDVRRFKIEF